MAKTITLKILQNFTDKVTNKHYDRNDEVEFSEKRAEELLKNPYLVKKIGENEITEKTLESKTEKISK